MTLTAEQTQAEANLVATYPGGLGFNVTDEAATTLAVYDELVERGRATVITGADDEQLAGTRSYRLSDAAAEAHRQVVQQRADQADLH